MRHHLEFYHKPAHVIGTSVFLMVVDIIVVGLRFKVRRLQKLPLGPDDWIMIPALIMVVLSAIDIIYGVSRKALACRTEVPPDDLTFEFITDQVHLSFEIAFMFNILFVLAIGLVKASVLFFYLRIFSLKNKVRVTLIALITIVAMWTVAWLFESIFNCKLNLWNIQGPSKDLKTKCVDISAADLALCVTDFFMDLIIIVFPIPLIWNLNVSTCRKIATSGIFLLGVATIATSLIRVVLSARIIAIGLAPDSDQVLVVTEYLYWGMFECGIAVVVACLPTLAFLFRNFPCESIKSAMRRLFCISKSRDVENSPTQARTSADQIYPTPNSSIRSGLSSRQRMWGAVSDDPIYELEFYTTKDIANVRESV